MSIIFYIKQVLSGKTLGRILFNKKIIQYSHYLSGRVLDLAGGAGSYNSFLPVDIQLVRTDIHSEENSCVVDFNEPLPFLDNSFNAILLFHAIYIVKKPKILMEEINRILKPGGLAMVASPFMQNEMREPHDYRRFTSEGLERLFRESGFSNYEIIPYGERFAVVAHILHPFWYFSIIRLFIYTFAQAFDRLIPKRVRKNHPTPIGYFCIIRKS